MRASRQLWLRPNHSVPRNVLELSVRSFSNITCSLRKYADEGDSLIISLALALIHW
jgi:hypothetical protein